MCVSGGKEGEIRYKIGEGGGIIQRVFWDDIGGFLLTAHTHTHTHTHTRLHIPPPNLTGILNSHLDRC